MTKARGRNGAGRTARAGRGGSAPAAIAMLDVGRKRPAAYQPPGASAAVARHGLHRPLRRFQAAEMIASATYVSAAKSSSVFWGSGR